jgi:hypothetical protein
MDEAARERHRSHATRRHSGAQAIGAIVQRSAVQAGPKGDFVGHSLRSGFITEGGPQGVVLPDLMALTEHRRWRRPSAIFRPAALKPITPGGC